jgi:hypothetical protein
MLIRKGRGRRMADEACLQFLLLIVCAILLTFVVIFGSDANIGKIIDGLVNVLTKHL